MTSRVLGVVLGVVLGAAVLALVPTPRLTAQGANLPPVIQPRNAADSLLESRTTELARELRCPVCQGLSIQDSPSELSQQMRALVKEQIVSGKSDEDVLAYFVSKYGEWILLAPKARGFNLVAYLLPPLLLVAGAVGVWMLVKSWTRQPQVVSASSGAEAPPED